MQVQDSPLQQFLGPGEEVELVLLDAPGPGHGDGVELQGQEGQHQVAACQSGGFSLVK